MCFSSAQTLPQRALGSTRLPAAYMLTYSTNWRTTVLKTSSWFAVLPARHVRVGISRGVPRGGSAGSGYKRYSALNPGPWFNSVSVPEYLTRYRDILDKLEPKKVLDDLKAIAGSGTPVIACFEAAEKIETGEVWCHRHLVAQWLEDSLGIEIEELNYPKLDRWAKLRQDGVPPPRWTQRWP